MGAVTGSQWLWFGLGCFGGVIVIEIYASLRLQRLLRELRAEVKREHLRKLADDGFKMRRELHERIRPMRMP